MTIQESNPIRAGQGRGFSRSKRRVADFGSFCTYLKSILPDGRPVVNQWKTMSEVSATTPLSDRISKEMKQQGFKFFGTAVCYARLQAVGYVNDHPADCFCDSRHL